MNKFLTFSAPVRAMFEDDAANFAAFSQLMIDRANGTQAVSADEADAKIREIFNGVLGIDKNSKPAEVRRAIRRNQALLFDIIEETLETMLMTGWQGSEFFNQYVDVRNLALGDRNAFMVEDDSLFTVVKIAGNHHDIRRQRLGAGEEISIPTAWYGVRTISTRIK